MKYMNMKLSLIFIFLNVGYSINKVSSADISSEDTLELFIENVTDTSAHVSWSLAVPNISITEYTIFSKVIHTFSNKTLYPMQWTYSNNTFRIELVEFQPGTDYNVTLRAVTQNGTKLEKWKTFQTKIGEPTDLPSSPEILKADEQTIVIKVHPVWNNNGPVSFYRIVVLDTSQNQVYQPELLKPYHDAVLDGLSFYVTGHVLPEVAEKEFVIGDGKYYSGYYNAPLHRNAHYKVLAGVVSTRNGVMKIREPVLTSNILSVENNYEEGSSLVMALSIAIVLASLLLIASVVVLLILRNRYHRNRRQRLSDNQELCIQGPMIQVANQAYIPDEDCVPVNHYKVLKEKIWNIPRDCLKVDNDNILGFGTFGHVVTGEVYRNNTVSPVLCYHISDGDMKFEEKRYMLRQLDVLVKADRQENLIKFIGTCENAESVFIVLEYIPITFKDVLLSQRNLSNESNRFSNLSETQMILILTGIAKGMEHLSKNNLNHERLCARSILITDNFTPKITNHGISHFNKENLVIDFTRWTAPEVFKLKQCVQKSDVWSYGCLAWEACAFGGTPYSTLESRSVGPEVTRGVRLKQLNYISEEFYQFMLNCWQYDTEERPTFSDIIQQMNYFKETLSFHNHLNFDNFIDLKFEPYIPAMEVMEENIVLK